MPNLIVIDCRETTAGFTHSVYNGKNKIVDVCLEAVIVNLQAMEELRTKPLDFVKKYDVTYREAFLLRN